MDWESLRQNISGTLITSEAADFLTHRDAMVWNEIKPDRIPDGIVTVTNDEDVIASIDFNLVYSVAQLPYLPSR